MSPAAAALAPVVDVHPYAAREAFAALLAHAVPGLERVEASTGTYERLVPTPAGPRLLQAHFAGDRVTVSARIRPGSVDQLGAVGHRVRQWLDLDTDLAAAARHLGGDPVLGPLVAANPTLRILGAFDGFEATVMTVLGQHVSLQAAQTFAARLVQRWGVLDADSTLREFPSPATLSVADATQLQSVVGVTGARARTVVALAQACAQGLVIAPDSDHSEVRRRLLALPGIGPWTVDYVAMRALRDADAFPHGDLVLRKALDLPTQHEVLTRSAGWAPWRAYAAIHLWHHAAYAKHL
ncbi:DNA-3-methyladenine glycosylase [Phycicoccus sp. Root563]|uniref:DNA-3-methyladenine glycosylase family protein n=1 Tax=Phycicoccus sp. Root563 TaxID=1736562 RepID=UPI0009EA714E|nr:AlkA N-terminal domain-containing protein [Phycicoccus sp. Root563]